MEVVTWMPVVIALATLIFSALSLRQKASREFVSDLRDHLQEYRLEVTVLK